MNASVEELSQDKVAQIVEAALLAAEGPITVDGLYKLFLMASWALKKGAKKFAKY